MTDDKVEVVIEWRLWYNILIVYMYVFKLCLHWCTTRLSTRTVSTC